VDLAEFRDALREVRNNFQVCGIRLLRGSDGRSKKKQENRRSRGEKSEFA
jgi:hypothetical protein